MWKLIKVLVVLVVLMGVAIVVPTCQAAMKAANKGDQGARVVEMPGQQNADVGVEARPLTKSELAVALPQPGPLASAIIGHSRADVRKFLGTPLKVEPGQGGPGESSDTFARDTVQLQVWYDKGDRERKPDCGAFVDWRAGRAFNFVRWERDLRWVAYRIEAGKLVAWLWGGR